MNMRRKQCEIKSINVIEQILQRETIGRMATIGKDGFPYITPVNYVYLNGSIFFHCAHEGEKIDNILRDSKVCFEVDVPLSYLGMEFDPERPPCQVHQFYHCVIIRGRAELVEEINVKVAALNALMTSHEKNNKFKQITAETEAVELCSIVRIRVESITGKSDLAQKKSSDTKKRIASYLKKRNLPGDGEAAALIGD